MTQNGLSPDLLEEIVQQWIAAFNAHNVEAIVALYAEDAELFDSGMRHPRRGRSEIAGWFRTRFHSIPSIAYVPRDSVLVGVNRAMVTWTTSGRTPAYFGLSWLSRPFQADGVSVFELEGGHILRQRGYYDHLAVVELVLPPVKWLLPVRL